MGLSPLSKKNVRMMESETGKRIAWGSVCCHNHENIRERGQWFRFWEFISESEVRLGYFNTKTRQVEMTGVTQSWTEDLA